MKIPSYTQKQLLGLLELITNRSHWLLVRDYELGNIIISEAQQERIEVIDKTWCGFSWEYYNKRNPVDLKNEEYWRTYGNCREYKFRIKDGKLMCDVTIYDGDSFDGYKVDKRWTATIILKNNFVKHLKKYIDWKINDIAEDDYERKLENQKRDWIKAYKEALVLDPNIQPNL